jgi:hypothetical protein
MRNLDSYFTKLMLAFEFYSVVMCLDENAYKNRHCDRLISQPRGGSVEQNR